MKLLCFYRNYTLLFTFSFLIFTSCSLQIQISKSASQLVLKDSSLLTAHVGISIFEPATNKYWFNYQGDHYFVPASNTKIPTCYAAMKYLGDSLAGVLKIENDTAIFLFPTGDPTFLHPDFKNQPVISFLQNAEKNLYTTDTMWKAEALGSGWSYGNLVKWIQEKTSDNDPVLIYSVPEVNWKVDFNTGEAKTFFVKRNIGENIYKLTEGKENFKEQSVPFVTNGIKTTLELLQDSIHKTIGLLPPAVIQKILTNTTFVGNSIKTQPTDTLLKITMHRSDNFFAEQTLLMVSNKLLLGEMSDERIIDILLKTDFKDLPQKPGWVDGSGLSRYNLFTPEDFVAIFNKMKNEFGMERIRVIFPTGNEGTLNNYYKPDNGYIFAKTGTLSGVVSLSGFLYTKKNKLLIFSVLVNNHTSSATAVRRAVEKFIEGIRNTY